MYLLFRTAILLYHPEFDRNFFLVNDYQHFHDLGIYYNPIPNGSLANVFSLPDDKWKSLRNKLTFNIYVWEIKKYVPNIY